MSEYTPETLRGRAMKLWQRIIAWCASSVLLLDFPSECRICGKRGLESEVRRHIIMEHYEAYRHARKHGRLP